MRTAPKSAAANPVRRAALRATDRLGRRPGEPETRNEILDAAEKAFARHGYAGTSLREIASRAGVNPALVQYYFGSKEGLFTAIFIRRGQELAHARMEKLDELEGRTDRPPGVEEIVRAYLAPAFDLMRRGAGGIAFMRLQARLQSDPGGLSLSLRTSVYEECVQRFVSAFRSALPDQPPELIYWRMTFMIGAYLHTISDANRLEVLSSGRCSSKDRDAALAQLIQFFVAGLSAPPPPHT